MLLMNAIRRCCELSATAEFSATRAERRFLSAQRGGTRPPSMISGTTPSQAFDSYSRLIQRLTQIFENVVDVFDADAQPNHFRSDSHLSLLFWRQLPVRSRCRMTGERLGIAHVDHALEQLEGVEGLSASLIAALHTESQQRTEVGAEIAVRHGIERIVGKPDIVHPCNHGMGAKKFRHLAGVFNMALHAESQCLNPLQKQKAVKRRQGSTRISLANGTAARNEC